MGLLLLLKLLLVVVSWLVPWSEQMAAQSGQPMVVFLPELPLHQVKKH